jgi:hypothetical protein
VLVPVTWKVTGWLMVGWSPEFPVGEVRRLHYFGEDLVTYRDERGELHVLDAHCKSGVTRSMWNTRHCPRSMTKGIWHCRNGRLSSTKCPHD